ncbi:Actin cytoskeleton-regulatory complex protein SLA1 [Psilocybe cubensis]|uniref:Actin cytoskeleton-regulatory complex protein SLA1 n=2 Tax=Psilocybe cubensis TaxID=181762 RepID=A0A8H7XZE2_PSICU|nr:Actin cytoskeleton-regulatory complex protein SLA1 [Psilocybe cubensis]KAH9483050.1 Actin cytoskeleton-regulatory complex protein SLA1 [Psilocybe cubensis]
MASEEPESYLAILKASYDYTPQSDDEIAIKEDQLLLLVEKVDDEWWKVKIKSSSQESDSPVGLVPAAYVEQAEHTSVVKALYDYEAASPGELSLREDDVLLVFDTEEDWILVQNANEEGKAGYVPGNYVEVAGEEEPAAPAPAPARIIVPDSPPRPVSSYVDPAERVASTKAASQADPDDIQTWSLSEIDKKGKKKKGTLGIGKGAVYFISEADKTPVQKWQTKDVSSVTSEKAKHVTINIGGANPITLHFHAGSKDNADAIISKLNTSKALSSGGAVHEEDSPSGRGADTSARDPKSVHFSAAGPVIIPDQGQDDEEEEEEEEYEPPSSQAIPPRAVPPTPARPAAASSSAAVALYDFTADGEDELTVKEGEQLTILEKDGDEWWKCRNAQGVEGVVPASYLEESGAAPASSTPAVASVDREAEDRAARELARQQEEDRLQQEEEEKKRAAAAARKAQAQQKAKEAALAAEAERQKRKEAAAAARVSTPPTTRSPVSADSSRSPTTSNSRTSTEATRPPPESTRIWHDRTGQFRVEAAFLGFNNGKLRLHKVNGVVVEVPSEKMSLDDMRYVERYLEKVKQRPSNVPGLSEDDIPLALSVKGKHATSSSSSSSQQQQQQQQRATSTPPPKKAPKIDWFDFFLSAGCDLDDCTRYASSFEKDKIDETLLADITEGTMRSLGLREGDIIRVKKAIEKRKPTDNLNKPNPRVEEQLRMDEEYARALQAQENGGPKAAAPNLFAGPGGVLKPRRGRPQPNKSLPLSTVDMKAIGSVPESIQRTTSPLAQSPATAQSATLPARPSSAAPVSGFDDDAWTNRPSSTKPVSSPPPNRTPSAPPQTQPLVPTPAPAAAPAAQPQPTPTPTVSAPPPQTTPAPAVVATPPVPTPTTTTTTTPSLANTTDTDIFNQLARLSALRQNTTPQPPVVNLTPSPVSVVPPASYRAGFGMSSSPLPMGQISIQPTLSPPATQPQPYNGPRGPFAPVPANQSLLQPLIPTQTGFGGFIPTKPTLNSSPSPFQSTLGAPSFLSTQPTGFGGGGHQPLMSQPTGFTPMMSQPTGFQPQQPMMSQPTGVFNSNFGPTNGIGSQPLQSHITGFNPTPSNQSSFPNFGGLSSPPPLPNNNQTNNTSPANVFAQMKSGTFANDNENSSTGTNGLNGQTPTWGQSYQGYTGY